LQESNASLCNAPFEVCFPPPQDPDRIGLHPPLRRPLEEGRATIETMGGDLVRGS